MAERYYLHYAGIHLKWPLYWICCQFIFSLRLGGERRGYEIEGVHLGLNAGDGYQRMRRWLSEYMQTRSGKES